MNKKTVLIIAGLMAAITVGALLLKKPSAPISSNAAPCTRATVLQMLKSAPLYSLPATSTLGNPNGYVQVALFYNPPLPAGMTAALTDLVQTEPQLVIFYRDLSDTNNAYLAKSLCIQSFPAAAIHVQSSAPGAPSEVALLQGLTDGTTAEARLGDQINMLGAVH